MNTIKDISKPEVEKEYTILNLGPTHPATHGIFQRERLILPHPE